MQQHTESCCDSVQVARLAEFLVEMSVCSGISNEVRNGVSKGAAVRLIWGNKQNI